MALKFAVVREDPEVELTLARERGHRDLLVVASGGCTAFALRAALPQARVTLFDFNPEQLAHVAARARAIGRGDLRALNVGDAAPTGLSQCGAFESLFRVLRQAVVELVVDAPALEAWFEAGPRPGSADAARRWFESPYWPAVFSVAFAEPLLVAMFGPAAVQHARPGSYPAYFQAALERGLRRDDGPRNPFLQHILLGRYLPRDAPTFLASGREERFETVLGGLLDVPELERHDFVHLSNIFDWSDDALVARWCERLERLRPGATVTFRQLNNARDLRGFLAPHFDFDDALGARLQREDRSLFYERIEVARRRHGVLQASRATDRRAPAAAGEARGALRDDAT